uniref:Arginine/serine-rich protein PNISR n=1 Tax=Elaeophora elaphi TaxID=1147741 RepID=A0A0R3S336_9BILA
MAENNAKWLDASYYQNMPNSEVNWAQLAQKWMQMRDAGEVPPATSGDSIPPPPNKELIPSHPPPAPDGLPVNGSFLPPGGYLPTIPVDANFATPSPCWMPPLPPNNFVPPGGGAFPPFMPPVPPWMGVTPVPPGPFPPAPPYGDGKPSVDEEEGGEASFLCHFLLILNIFYSIFCVQIFQLYSHYYKEWEEKQKSGRRDNDSDDSETVPEGAMAHWLKPGPGWAPPPNWYHPSRRDSPSNSHSMPFIDQQTRKTLPAWIREGLEKAEQERQKKQTKEAKLRAAEEAAKAHRASKGLGKFDSDSSEDENGTEDTKERIKLDEEPVFLQKKKLEKHHEQSAKDIAEIDYRTEEETREDALMLLRRFMTEILLETTDDELSRIAKEQIEIAKRSAQPKVLAQSSALAALCTLGAESDDESSEEADVKQWDESTNKAKGEELPKKSSTSTSAGGNGGGNEDEALFNMPLLPVSSGAKSKAKLSSNDGFSSTESSQGVEKKKTAVQGKKNGDDGSSRVALSKNESDACKEIGRKKFDSNNDGGNKKDKKEKHIGESKKQHQRKKSRSRERPKKRRRGNSKEGSTKKDTDHALDASDSDKSGSRTPERYRRRSSSRESYHKRRRSRSHKRLRSRSRSRTKRSRRFEERRNSRSRSRERRRSGERHHRDRYSRRSRS